MLLKHAYPQIERSMWGNGGDRIIVLVLGVGAIEVSFATDIRRDDPTQIGPQGTVLPCRGGALDRGAGESQGMRGFSPTWAEKQVDRVDCVSKETSWVVRCCVEKLGCT